MCLNTSYEARTHLDSGGVPSAVLAALTPLSSAWARPRAGLIFGTQGQYPSLVSAREVGGGTPLGIQYGKPLLVDRRSALPALEPSTAPSLREPACP